MAAGYQEEFSRRQVGISALGDGVTAGLGAAFSGAQGGFASKFGLATRGSNAAAAINAAVNSVATQGALVATGLKDKFSWKSVAASAVAAAVSNQIGSTILGDAKFDSNGNPLLDDNGNVARNLTNFARNNAGAARAVTSLISAVTGAYIRHGITNNQINFRDVAADSIGNTLADEIVGGLAAGVETPNTLAVESEMADESAGYFGGLSQTASGGAGLQIGDQDISAFDDGIRNAYRSRLSYGSGTDEDFSFEGGESVFTGERYQVAAADTPNLTFDDFGNYVPQTASDAQTYRDAYLDSAKQVGRGTGKFLFDLVTELPLEAYDAGQIWGGAALGKSRAEIGPSLVSGLGRWLNSNPDGTVGDLAGDLIKTPIRSYRALAAGDLETGTQESLNSLLLFRGGLSAGKVVGGGVRNLANKFEFVNVQQRFGQTGAIGIRLKGIRLQGFQDHHIISDKNLLTKNHELLDLSGFDLQSRSNKVLLPKTEGLHPSRSIHYGKHLNSVSESLANQMDAVVEVGRQNRWTQQQYRQALDAIISQERSELKLGVRELNKNVRSK